MRKINPLLVTDFYKIIHPKCYVEGLEYTTSYWIPRMSRLENINEVVMFGLQGVIKEILIEDFNEHFFNIPLNEVIEEYKLAISDIESEESADTYHIEDLHELGFLPIKINAIKEGTLVPTKVPMFSIENTVKGFGWLTNGIETLLSSNIWFPMTSATKGYLYRQIVNKYYDKTVDDMSLCKRAIGDFSMRGQTSSESAIRSSSAFLTSFLSSATVPSYFYLRDYYAGEVGNGSIMKGTCSTEHSIMSSYLRENEFDCYKHLINDVFPKGNLSIVSDTYDLWNVIQNYLPKLKEDIMSRDGKIIIRPDSGNPCDIICGKENSLDERESKGVVELLWDIFGGTINSRGYKVLDSHIGCIYGDSITLERAEEIYDRLEKKGFASNNVVLGAGSYSFQYNTTRDTFSFALKLCHAVVNGEERLIYKDPITDDGNFKKSIKGKCVVFKDENGSIVYKDQMIINDVKNFKGNLLEPIFRNGEMVKEQSLKEIRNRLNKGEF